MSSRKSEMKRSHKVALSLAVLMFAASLIGLGAFAAFTDSESQAQDVATGTFDLVLGTAGTADNRVDVDVTGLAPGDTAQRAIKLTNGGTVGFKELQVTTTHTGGACPGGNALYCDGTDGLQVKLESCTGTWTENGPAPAYTYTCSGATNAVLSYRAVNMTGQVLSIPAADLEPADANMLVLTVQLPSAAGNGFQNLSDTVSYSFDAIQRDATAR